jgi:hypothetical protein
VTRDDLRTWEQELKPLVPLEDASPLARHDALAFNADAKDAREALLATARELVDEGAAPPELEPCLARTVAELAFWRRVLVDVHGGDLADDQAGPDFLVRYLLS